MEQVLYELEDFIGGHSAVANLLIRALIEVAAVPGLSQKIHRRVRERKYSMNYKITHVSMNALLRKVNQLALVLKYLTYLQITTLTLYY